MIKLLAIFLCFLFMFSSCERNEQVFHSFKSEDLRVVVLKEKGIEYCICFYKDGKIAQSGQVEGVKREGEWYGWYENGNIAYEGLFRDGERNGGFVLYSADSSGKVIGTFEKDKMVGMWKEIYEQDTLTYFEDGTRTMLLPQFTLDCMNVLRSTDVRSF